jgi:hypothetical protein
MVHQPASRRSGPPLRAHPDDPLICSLYIWLTFIFRQLSTFSSLWRGFKVNRHSLCAAWNLPLLHVKHVLTVGVFSLCGITSAMSQQISTWESIGNPLGDSLVDGITVDPMNDSVYYVTSYNGLHVTRDRGNQWTRYLSG